MRTFIVYSKTAKTSPIIRDLKKAGRIDVLLHSIISALFASNKFRSDVKLHLILMGPPTPPRHIMITYNKDNTISKKDLKKLIEIALRKYKEEQTREVHPGVFIDNKTIEQVVEDHKDQPIYFLDTNAKHIKNFKKEELLSSVFILGDHEGFDKPAKKFLKKNTQKLSLGKQIYFTSQAITIINYELDNF